MATDVSKAPKDAHAAASGHMTARAGKVPVAGAGAVDVPLSELKKAMAQEASDSKISIPHYYLSSLIYLDEILRSYLFHILCTPGYPDYPYKWS